MMDHDELLFDAKEGIATLTLNRPNRLNAFTDSMYQEIPNIIDRVRRDDEIKVLFITGAGRGFCAGSDVSAVSGRLDSSSKKPDKKSRFQTLEQLGGIALDIADLDKPVIAAINGVAVGSGFSFALLADIRLASENARLGATWIKIGLVPDMGATYYLPRIVGLTKAMELLLSGDLLSAEEALQIGLVSQVIPSDKLLSTARELAGKIVASPSIAVELTKRGLQRSLTNDLKSQLDYETYAQNVCRQSEDAKEGIRAFMEKRKPNFTGH